MNKEKALERLDAIELESKKLREIIKAPEQRTPEAGDVWHDDCSGVDYLLLNDGYKVVGGDVVVKMKISCSPWATGNYTYLGKFDEVYVNRAEFISDVRAALSHEDNWGDSCYKSIKGISNHPCISVEAKTREALRELNII